MPYILGQSLSRKHCSTAFALGLMGLCGLGHAGIVTLGPDPQPLPECPFSAALPWICKVDTAAQVLGPVTTYEAVRIGQSGVGSLTVDGGNPGGAPANVLSLQSTQTSANLIVGDNVGSVAALSVVNGGTVTINVPAAGNGSGGIIVGAFGGPGNAANPSTTMLIKDGASVTVNKPGGLGPVASAVGVGFGPGSFSSLLLDGGIGNFGSQALGATLSTTGNLSIGRQGSGAVFLTRNATVNANVVYLSAIDPAGSSFLDIGFLSTVTAGGGVYAGIGLSPSTGLPDATVTSHGTGIVHVLDTGSLAGTLTLGAGGTLYGTGHVAQVNSLGGTVAPGNSPGTLHIGSGGYHDVDGHLVIEFGTSGFDQLLVDGPVSMQGTTIDFRFIEGFVPGIGFNFDFLDSTDDMLDLQNLQFSYSRLADGFSFAVAPGADGRLIFTALNNGVALPTPPTLALVAIALLAGWAAPRRPARPGPTGDAAVR